jgi:hypothetical protein
MTLRYTHALAKAAIGGTNSALVEVLRHKYPIGANPLFPTKRVYTCDGRSWELNDIRLQVWAHQMVRI